MQADRLHSLPGPQVNRPLLQTHTSAIRLNAVPNSLGGTILKQILRRKVVGTWLSAGIPLQSVAFILPDTRMTVHRVVVLMACRLSGDIHRPNIAGAL